MEFVVGLVTGLGTNQTEVWQGLMESIIRGTAQTSVSQLVLQKSF